MTTLPDEAALAGGDRVRVRLGGTCRAPRRHFGHRYEGLEGVVLAVRVEPCPDDGHCVLVELRHWAVLGSGWFSQTELERIEHP